MFGLTWLLFSSKFQKWPWQSTQGFTFLSWNHRHLTNIMVEHNPLEESTSFILMKHFVFFITFAKIADWIDPEVNLKSQKNVRKWSYENFFCTFFNDNKILNSIISERFFELFASYYKEAEANVNKIFSNNFCPKICMSILKTNRQKQSFLRKNIHFLKCQESFQSSCSTTFDSKCLWFNDWIVNICEICHSHFCNTDRRGN